MRCVKVSMGAAARIGLERVIDADVTASLRMPRQWIAEVVVVQTGLLFATEKFEVLPLRT